MRLRPLSLALLLAACTGGSSQPAPQDSSKTAASAPATTAPPATPTDAPQQPGPQASTPPTSAVAWWCTCYSRTGPVAMTACRTDLADCKALEQKALRGQAGIVPGSLTHVCREVRGDHPGDALGGRDKWQPSKKPGAWVSGGA